MFDVGFSELIVIGIVALVVIGPERLPKVARTVGVLTGRLQRYVAQVKSDINREMELSELSKVKSEFESAARSFQGDVQSSAAEVEREIREAQGAIERDLNAKLAAPGVDAPVASAPPAANDGADAPPPSPQLDLELPEQPATRDKANG
jgi:sec-independent protein translocase protein TatB